MKIEIRKVGFINKGAELMLHAIMQEVLKEWPDTMFVMEPSRNAPYLQRAQLGIYQKLNFNWHGLPVHKLGHLTPRTLRRSYGLILDSEIDVVLDAAGFAYSDQWGETGTIALGDAVKRWKSHNKKVILLPQAFGPFTSAGIKRAIENVADHADLIYARDPVSYASLVEVAEERPNIKMAPDFTNLIDGIVPPDFNTERNRFCIIPNYRMIDKTPPEVREAYVPFLITCIRHLQRKGAKPFILIHEGGNDLKLAQQVIGALDERVEIVTETNPLMIKGMLGTCEGSLGSRFHGLVSALSQGVPSLGTGWSHKYQMLFDSYHFSEGLLPPLSSNAEIIDKINMIVDEPSKSKIRERIARNATAQKQMARNMWREVFHEINSK